MVLSGAAAATEDAIWINIFTQEDSAIGMIRTLEPSNSRRGETKRLSTLERYSCIYRARYCTIFYLRLFLTELGKIIDLTRERGQSPH